ncbi:MAG: hypothetical protein ACTSQA_08070 [Candidatus Heimdallarchaeaceae archaeon]
MQIGQYFTDTISKTTRSPPKYKYAPHINRFITVYMTSLLNVDDIIRLNSKFQG